MFYMPNIFYPKRWASTRPISLLARTDEVIE
jgi:hypothetical protein